MSSQENNPNSESASESENPCDACGCCGQPDNAACPDNTTKTGRRLHGCWGIVFFVLGLCFLVALLLPAISSCPEAVRRATCTNNLKNIALALLNYESRYGQFPPAYTVDENGRPMHSWRVLILPYMDRKDLYDQYCLDEPWHSPHNRRLLTEENCPTVFRCPKEDQSGQAETSYVMIVGPGCVSEGTTSVGIKGVKGMKHTILVAEVANSGIRWTEPRDLDATTMSYKINDPEKPSISSNHADIALAVFADGSVHPLDESANPEMIRKMTQRNAEPTEPDR